MYQDSYKPKTLGSKLWSLVYTGLLRLFVVFLSVICFVFFMVLTVMGVSQCMDGDWFGFIPLVLALGSVFLSQVRYV